ncbi:TPA: hypothetical protein DD712_02305, partial [Candidatus Acetothermia bacterium]|nr:hypothetical protein [Candidatus Acetothermia bacterium]
VGAGPMKQACPPACAGTGLRRQGTAQDKHAVPLRLLTLDLGSWTFSDFCSLFSILRSVYISVNPWFEAFHISASMGLLNAYVVSRLTDY